MKSGRDTTHLKTTRRFVTKTLVNKDGDIQRRIMAMFQIEPAAGTGKTRFGQSDSNVNI
uniref:Helix-turn-helix domain-containing protein n=1 Tax=Escherichia coli TaxID=562 RepID=A0A3G4RXI4_ECOLX|nr:helix-turn-helix domain-containing protein [Escherichia coli]